MSLIPYIGVVYRHKINEIEIQNEFATPPPKKIPNQKTSNKKKKCIPSHQRSKLHSHFITPPPH